MIYLIGGAPRTGKTSLAQMMMNKNNIPFCSTDALYHMILEAAPSLGIKEGGGFQKKAQDFYPFLKAFLQQKAWGVRDYCIEGDAFLPEQINILRKELPDEKFRFKVCFIGFSKLTLKEVLDHTGFNTWMVHKPQKEQEEIVRHIIDRSTLIKEECQKNNIPYFDLSNDYQGSLEKAYQSLIGS